MIQKLITIAILVLPILAAGTCPPSAEIGNGQLVFASGFGANISDANVYDGTGGGGQLSGTDQVTGFSWDNPGHPLVESHNFQYVTMNCAGQSVVETEIMSAFQGLSDVLKMQVNSDPDGCPSRTRNELMFKPASSVRTDYQIYTRYRMYLPPDYAERIDLSEQHWNLIVESKHYNLPDKSNSNGSWRFNLNIFQDDRTPYWRLNKNYQPIDNSCSSDKCDDGNISNKNIPVPLGEWFWVEVFYKKHASNGRILFAVNGQTVFDFNGRTQHPTDPTGVNFFSMFKNYRGDGHFVYAPFAHYYDDLEIWTDFPPGCTTAIEAPLVTGQAASALSVLPNPVSSFVQVRRLLPARFVVYDLQGRVVRGSQPPNGVYVLQLTTGSRVMQKRVLLLR